MTLLPLLLLYGIAQAGAVGGAADDDGRRVGVVYAAAPEERGAFHVGGKGVYNYGYNTGDGVAKVEVRHPDGSVTGSYRYYDPLGRQILRSYIADKKGFRVLGNELPVGRGTPAIGFPSAQLLTGAVEGSRRFPAPAGSTLGQADGGTAQFPAPAGPFLGQAEQQRRLIEEQERRIAQLEAQQQTFLQQQQRQIDQLREIQRRTGSEPAHTSGTGSESAHTSGTGSESAHTSGTGSEPAHTSGTGSESEQDKKTGSESAQKILGTGSEPAHTSGTGSESVKKILGTGSEPAYTSGTGSKPVQRIFGTGYTNQLPQESPYFYADDYILYDFPAGFGYPAQPAPVYYSPIGVKGHASKGRLTAGHTVTRVKGPIYSLRRSIGGFKRPFTLGHA